MRTSTTTRHRGPRDWRPTTDTICYLGHVRQVLDEYADHLPLTSRQVYYRLIGAHGWPKGTASENRLENILDAGRRSGRIPFEAIRDDGGTVEAVGMFEGLGGFKAAVLGAAEGYQIDHQRGQAQHLEVWTEAAGMVPQIARVVEPYGVPVLLVGWVRLASP